MAILSIAAIVGGGAALGGIAQGATASAPTAPNTAAASRKVTKAQAKALPTQRGLAFAEQAGTQGPAVGYKEKVPTKADLARWKNAKPGTANRIAYDSYAGDFSKVYTDGKGNLISRDEAVPNFAGLGTADIAGQLARKQADLQVMLGQKYGVDYAKELAHEAELADPEGTKAREIENELIQKQIQAPINPVSAQVESQVRGQQQAGAGFDAMTQDLLDSAVAKANQARGGGPTSADVGRTLSTGTAGAARRQAAEGKAQSFLASGQTPEDLAYRREQQNISNLGSFVSGQTPESQFGALARAGQGSSPTYTGQALPGMPAGGASAGNAYSVGSWKDQMNASGNQANSWLGGISSLLSMAGSIGMMV